MDNKNLVKVTFAWGVVSSGDNAGVPAPVGFGNTDPAIAWVTPKFGAIYENKLRLFLEDPDENPCNVLKVEWPSEAIRQLGFKQVNDKRISDFDKENRVNTRTEILPLQQLSQLPGNEAKTAKKSAPQAESAGQ